MIKVDSIDGAAVGFVRHRFVRALNASLVVAIVFGVLALGVSTAGIGEMAIVAALLLALLMMTIVALIGVAIDLLHRRLVGLVMLLSSGALTVFFVWVVIGAARALITGDLPSLPDRTLSPTAIAALGALGVIGALTNYQCAWHGLWQLTVGGSRYRAARGWRPPVWRLLTTFQRHLGLPAFLAHIGAGRLGASLLYFLVAILNIGLLLAPLIAFLLITPQRAENWFDPQALLIGAGVLLALNLIGAGALVSKLADGRTTKVYQAVREWDARAPIVFLRAFDQDSHKLRTRGGDVFARWAAGIGKQRTLDEILLEHASPYGPLIAIGDPRDPTPPLGAARVFVPGQGAGWQDVVRGLVDASKAVVICPNHGEGVKWELDLLADGRARLNVIYLASPELSRADALALFQQIVPSMPEIKRTQWPLAAYQRDGGWRVLTSRRVSVDAAATALNFALQALLGMKGETLRRTR